MPAQPPTYDLTVLLDTSADEGSREKVLKEVEKIISSGGASVVGTHEWGVRKLAFEIRHKTDAEYHLVQFQGPPTVPAALDRYLRITDAVVRHRTIKLDPGTPDPPDLRSAAATPAAPNEDEYAAPAAELDAEAAAPAEAAPLAEAAPSEPAEPAAEVPEPEAEPAAEAPEPPEPDAEPAAEAPDES